jgi:hypothetical protein
MTRNRLSKRSLLSIAAALAGLLVQVSCGGGSSLATVTSVTITPGAASVGILNQQEFQAVVNLTNGTESTNTTVTWQVNGVTNGSAATGTIGPSPTDNQVGVYTAPPVVPATDNGEVDITAVVDQTDSTSTTTPVTVTSNTAVITVTIELGLTVTPALATVEAGGTKQFTAIQNELPDSSVTWGVSSVNGGNVGSISPSGLYTAPLFPPPGASVVITATTPDGLTSAVSNAKIIYSDASFSGPYAFSYSGGTGSGFQAVSGSIVTDGQGDIVSGVEDVTSFLTGTSTQIPIFSGNYAVGPDGRTNAVLNTGVETGVAWQFALTSNKHALLIGFNKSSGAIGTIDQQNLNDLSTSDSVLLACGSTVSCPYVFGASGSDLSFNTMGLAGRFSVNNVGMIPESGTILDVNDDGVVTDEDTSLNGSYSFDTVYAGTGRGTLTLTSNTTGQIQYAFYVVDSTHLKLVEIDHNGYLAGDMYSAPTGGPFSDTELTAGNYVFTSEGTSATGGFVSGGVFTSDGSANVTGGAFDSNANGTIGSSNAALGSCGFTTDSTTGRIDLKLFVGTGTCSGAGSTLNEFAMYPSASGPAVLLEIDANANTSGAAYLQAILTATPPVQAPVDGSFALNLGGEGVVTGTGTPSAQDLEGQVTLNGTSVGGGSLDINQLNAIYTADPVSTTTVPISTITAPSSAGRGTALLAGTDPSVSYAIVYYIIDNNTALLLDSDTVRLGIGAIARQF